MKNIFLKYIFLLLFLFLQTNYGQENTFSCKNDTLLKKFESVLPEGWSIFIKDNQLLIERGDSIWILLENKINAPIDFSKREDKIERIKKYGKKNKSRLIYIFEDRWNKEKIVNVNHGNDAIRHEIAKLPEKFMIVHLFNKNLSRKGEEIYIGTTDDENERINKYYREKIRLEKNIIKLPDYQTEKYSLFFLSEIGSNNEFYTVFPNQASEEMYKIKNLMNEIFINPNK
jgi:hypothetical protein